MSWLRNSPIRVSFNRRASSTSPPKDCDPLACFESFRRHWQQAHDIIVKTQANADGPSPDDVLGVVNNLEQLMSLLLLELKGPGNSEEQQHCLEHLLSENVLERLLMWSRLTSRYNNLRLEQLKLYEMLLSNAPQRQLLIHEPFLRPLLSLLSSCANEYFPPDTEKRLILLLNQLCVCLMQNPALLDLFFTSENGPGRFLIFGLLIPYVHREGGIGHQARDAMLLCMSLSKKNELLGRYIATHSNVCPVLATGLSGLFSRLPRKLAIETEDWHSFTPDDVNEMPELTLFLNSLEFCNAVVQVAHPLVQSQMLEFVYHGFLVPVVGPALLQSIEEELVATTAYLDLFLRSVTEPGLLQTFLRFLLTNHYDGERVIDKMIQRLGSKSRVTLYGVSVTV
ncbi:hypothetical protein B566_EDAN016912 [Ephemera danica]|nr:hypothetical protein B566_EDAN016912 [Ephemera danica]